MSFKIYRKEKKNNGRRNIYILGIKVFSYKGKTKSTNEDLSFEEIKAIQENYKIIEKNIAHKKLNGEKIKVAFLVSIASMFPAKPFFSFLRRQKDYDAKVIIIPDQRFGKEKAQKLQQECFICLKEEFGEDSLIMASLNEEKDNININNFADILFMSLPYDVSYPKYSLRSVIKQGVLPCCVSYGFFRSMYDREKLVSSKTYALYWKVFSETKYNQDEFNNFSLIKGENCVLTGYCKMDSYKDYENIKSDKKTILIAPHHSVDGGYNDVLALSNFYRYSELFLKLPDKYSNINFIFRPHPALFLLLSNKKFWGDEKVKKYISEMKSKKNVTYDESGNYFETFAKSDAIIQDCGSYLVEYFYTEKPQCYLLKQRGDIEGKFVELGQKCLENCYVAYDEKAIIDFIENVVIKGKDPKKQARIKFARQEVKVNYPNVSEKIFEYFEKKF